MTPKKLLLAVLLGTALSASALILTRSMQDEKPIGATVLPAPMALPDFTLLSHEGTPVLPETFRGRWDLVFFGFTHCPDICPTTLQLLSAVKSELAEQGIDPLPRIVLVSVDPERDTPELLGKYVAHFGDDNLGVTGTVTELRKLTTSLGVYFEKQPGNGDNYNVDHFAGVIVVDPDANFYAVYSAPHDIERYLHDLPIMMGSR